MKLFDIKKLAVVSALGVVTVLATGTIANAQRDRDDEVHKRDDQRNERKISQEQQKLDRQRAEAEQKRLRDEQKRQADWNRKNHGNGGVYNNGNNNNNNNNGDRYRVYRNGAYYNTDNRGAELLRQAANSGYQQGFNAGQSDRNSRRRSNWTTNNDYRSGSFGYDSHVDRSQYQYYFQQGFQRGYQDGYNSRNQYGNGGSLLGNILSGILNIQTY